MKTAREYVCACIMEANDAGTHFMKCDRATAAIRAAQIDAIRFAASKCYSAGDRIAIMDIIAELEREASK